MTVSELIEKLKEFESDLDVVIQIGGFYPTLAHKVLKTFDPYGKKEVLFICDDEKPE